MSVVTFDFGNGTKTTKVATYGEKYGELLDVEEKEGYTFNGWFTAEDGNGEEISSEAIVSIINDHNLYMYTGQQSTITLSLSFIIMVKDDETRILNYSDTINYPNNLIRQITKIVRKQ